MKISKFLLCQNPNLDSNTKYILHTRIPALLAEVIEHKDKLEQDNYGKKVFELAESDKIPFAFVGRTEVDNRYFSFFAFELYEKIPMNQKNVNEIAGIMRRMGDWYRNLIIEKKITG